MIFRDLAGSGLRGEPMNTHLEKADSLCNLSHNFHRECAPPWTPGVARVNFYQDWVLFVFS